MANNRVRIMIHGGREKVVARRLAEVLIKAGKAIEVKPVVTAKPSAKARKPTRAKAVTESPPEATEPEATEPEPTASAPDEEKQDAPAPRRTYRRRDLQAEE